jgi:uncharacterized membrane protein
LKRLAYIDWMRGLACLLMFQDHCYTSWLAPEYQRGEFNRWSQILGSMPAPLFLFLAGVSVALTTEKLREKGIARDQIARQTVLRGGEIFGLGILFRLMEYALGHRWVPWTDLLRVDILNILGVSIAFMGILCWFSAGATAEIAHRRSVFAGLATAAAIALLTPPLWTIWRPNFLSWPLESYINGVHNMNEPQNWLFPIFPWCAFAFVGLAAGFSLFSKVAQSQQSRFFWWMAGAGAGACVASEGLEHVPIKVYAVHDYWHSHPDFVLLRCGVLLILMSVAYAWCALGWGQKGFSPLIQLGKTSLLVYWVHIELVYGRFSILPKHQSSMGKTTLGLIVIFLAMLALSLWRTEAKGKLVRVLPPKLPGSPALATG